MDDVRLENLRREWIDIIVRAIGVGINFVDTANIYARGKSEETVAKALKQNRRHPRVVLTTKVQLRMHDEDPNGFGSSRWHIAEQCEASLRLRTVISQKLGSGSRELCKTSPRRRVALRVSSPLRGVPSNRVSPARSPGPVRKNSWKITSVR